MLITDDDFRLEFERRLKILQSVGDDQKKQAALIGHYKYDPIRFMNDWGMTFNPRNAGSKDKLSHMPFKLFPKQEELVRFIVSCMDDKESGLIEKARDMGATWVCGAISVWLWLFRDGSSVGWGSRKEQLVDRLGDMDAIFPKLRYMIERLPSWMLPAGFNPKDHMPFMRIINPKNGNVITGEAGDNIGRGGRSSVYFKDEAAHYERPELIEAALGDNTDTQIDISSVNGTANVFYKKRQAGQVWEYGADIAPGMTRVFVMDWRDHPLKDQEWYDKRKSKAEREGLSHIFAQEVDRDYRSAVVGVIIPAAWVKSAIDAHKILGFGNDGAKIAGLDIADDGQDANALISRSGIVADHCDHWRGVDTKVTAQNAIRILQSRGVYECFYDCIGVGAGVKGETNSDNGGIEFIPWNAGAKVKDPHKHVIPGDTQSPKNINHYENLKAQAWWSARMRFEKTHKCIQAKELIYPVDELISIDSAIPNRNQLENELSQPTMKKSAKGKIMVDKKPNGSSSPNLADAFIQCFFPVDPPIKKSNPSSNLHLSMIS